MNRSILCLSAALSLAIVLVAGCGGDGKATGLASEAVVRVDIVTGNNDLEPTAAQYDRYKRDMVALAKSRPVLLGALQDKQLQKTVWFQAVRDQGPAKASADLGKRLRVRSLAGSDLIAIGMSPNGRGEEDADETAVLVNAVAGAFVTQANREVIDKARTLLDDLTSQRQALIGQLQPIDQKIDALSAWAPAPAMTEKANALTVQLLGLMQQTTQLQASLSQIQAGRDALDLSIKDPAHLPGGADKALAADAALATLLTAELAVVGERDQALRSGQTATKPAVLAIDERLTKVRDQAGRRKRELLNAYIKAMLDQQSDALATVTAKLEALRQRYEKAMAEQRELTGTLTDIEQLEAQKKPLVERLMRLEGRMEATQKAMVDAKTLPAMIRKPARGFSEAGPGEPQKAPATAPATATEEASAQ